MKQLFFFVSIAVLSSFALHKFYVSIYQINYDANKQRLEITSRLFVDDLNVVMQKNYNKNFFIGTDKETKEELNLLKEYIDNHLTIKVNGIKKKSIFICKEIEGHELICYLKINEVQNLKTLEIQNTSFFELDDEQQNIIHFISKNKKQSFVQTRKGSKGIIKL
jgi:hypothetical protein